MPSFRCKIKKLRFQGILTDRETERILVALDKAENTDGDLISRKEAEQCCFNGWNKDYKEIAEDIKNLPTYSAEQTAEWLINPDDMAGCGYYICSNCENDVYETTDYCPNCGRRMKGVE